MLPLAFSMILELQLYVCACVRVRCAIDYVPLEKLRYYVYTYPNAHVYNDIDDFCDVMR